MAGVPCPRAVGNTIMWRDSCGGAAGFAAEEAVVAGGAGAAWNTRGYVLCEKLFHVRNTAVRLGLLLLGWVSLFGWMCSLRQCRLSGLCCLFCCFL